MIGITEIISIIIAIVVVFYGKGKTKMIKKFGEVVNEIRKIRI